jgi:hypothetical protein
VVKQENFLNELVKLDGNVTAACQAVGIIRQTYYKWTQQDPEFVSHMKNIREAMGDMIEDQVVKKIRSGSDYWMKQWLNAKHKDRGWGDTVKQEHTGDVNIHITKEVINGGQPN